LSGRGQARESRGGQISAGGTDSFGKHFINTVITQYTPKRLIVFSRDEPKQFEMQQEFPLEKYQSYATSSGTCATRIGWNWL